MGYKISLSGAGGILGVILALISLANPQFGVGTRILLLLGAAFLGAAALIFTNFGRWAKPWLRGLVLIGWFILVGSWIRGLGQAASVSVLPGPTPYPAASLDCFPDARVYQNRTLFQPSLPDDVMYVTERGSQEIRNMGPAPVFGSSGYLFQLSGMFVQCALTNEGDADLADVAVTFEYRFAPGYSETFTDKNGKVLPPGEFRTGIVWLRGYPPQVVEVTARRSFLGAHDKFNFAVVNFGTLIGFMGIALVEGASAVPPDLSFRLASGGATLSHQAVTLACRSDAALQSPMLSAEKSKKPWRFEEKCARMFIGLVKNAIRMNEQALKSLPPICKKYAKMIELFGAGGKCGDGSGIG